MADDSASLVLENIVSGYGKMTILNGTSATVRRGAYGVERGCISSPSRRT